MRKRELSDWINSYVEYVQIDEPPYMYKLWCAISVISAVLQRKCLLPWGNITFYPNMYVVLVGPSGSARKGTAMGPAQEFLVELCEAEYEIHMAAEAMTREALIRELAQSQHNEMNIDTGDMVFHSSLTIFAPELTVFLGYQNYQLMSDLTDWYDCRRRWTYRTKNMGSDEIYGVYVTLFGATTPDLVRTTLPMDAIGGGLTSRIIFVFEEGMDKPSPAPFLTPALLELKTKLKRDLENIHMLKGEFKFTPEFLDFWIEWYNYQFNHPPDMGQHFGGYVARRPMHVLKLSMILNASRSDKMVIDLSDLKRAIKIIEKTEEKMERTFSGMGLYSHAELLPKIMADIALRENKGMSLQELQDRYKFDANLKTLNEILETLETSGYIVVVDTLTEKKYIHKTSYEGGNNEKN